MDFSDVFWDFDIYSTSSGTGFAAMPRLVAHKHT